MSATREERLRLFEEYQRNKTPQDIRIEELEEENDARYLAELDPNEPALPIEELWRAWGLENRVPTAGTPRNRKTG
jgi:hypothetical protein